MKLILNGVEYEYRGDETLADLLREVGADPNQVAVLVNDEVIAASLRATMRLTEGSRVELLTLAAGG